MTGKDLIDDELEDELDKAFKDNEAKRDHCGTPMPSNKEELKRTGAKLKKDI